MKESEDVYMPSVYTAIAVLYNIRLYLTIPSLVSSAIFELFLLLSIYYFIRVVSEYNKYPVIRALLILSVLLGIYGFLLVLIPPDSTWLRYCLPYQFLIDYFEAILPIFAFFYFSNKGVINNKWLMRWTYLFICAAFIKYVGMQRESFTAVLAGEENVTRNAGYVALSLLPCVPFISKNNLVRYSFWVLIMVAVLFSIKRGAILLGGIAFLVFLREQLKFSKKNRKIIVIIASGIALYIIYDYVQTLLDSSDYFNNRLSATMEGDSSERDDLYVSYVHFFFYESSFFNVIFGNGAYGTLQYLGLMAHNDWLEFAIDMGLLGLIFFIIYWFLVWKMVFKSKSLCSEEVYLSLMLFSIVYFGKTFFSMTFLGMPVFASSAFGYCIGQFYRTNKFLKIQNEINKKSFSKEK